MHGWAQASVAVHWRCKKHEMFRELVRGRYPPVTVSLLSSLLVSLRQRMQGAGGGRTGFPLPRVRLVIISPRRANNAGSLSAARNFSLARKNPKEAEATSLSKSRLCWGLNSMVLSKSHAQARSLQAGLESDPMGVRSAAPRKPATLAWFAVYDGDKDTALVYPRLSAVVQPSLRGRLGVTCNQYICAIQARLRCTSGRCK